VSIRLPDTNAYANTTAQLPCYFTLPTTAGVKAANSGCIFGFWVMPPQRAQFELNSAVVLAARNLGAAGGADGRIRYANQAGTSIDAQWRNAGATLFTLSAAAPGLTAAPLFIAIIINPTNVHLCVMPVGGSLTVSTVANTTAWAANMSADAFVEHLGCAAGNAAAFTGAMEEAFMIGGEFPESAGVPDNALLQDIANGVQDLDTLDALMTGGAKRFRYRMRQTAELSDAFGVAADLTLNNPNVSMGKFLTSSGPLRPVSLIPAMTATRVSQAIFATAGNSASATASVRVEGGAYSGITPAAIQARLIKEDGTDHVPWTVIDPAPTGGTWQSGVIPNVPMVAGWLECEIRAVNGSGVQVGDAVRSYGLRGVGFSALQSAQSQLGTLWAISTVTALAVPTGLRFAVSRADNTRASEFIISRVSDTATVNENSRGCGWGIRQAAIEINARYPGVPIQMAWVGENGTPLSDYVPPGPRSGRWAIIDSFWGARQPYLFVPMGHSEAASIDYPAGLYADMIDHVAATCGDPIFTVGLPASRYSIAGTGGNYNAGTRPSRDAMYDWHFDNPTKSRWGGDFSVVTTDNEVTGSGHTTIDNAGQGRSGALIAWALMTASRAVEDVQIGIVSARRDGTTLRVKLGAI
jgi:hypothetical protein